MIKMYGKIKELIPKLLDLDSNEEYLIELKKPKDKRTLQQNKYMWKLIHEIAKKQMQDDMDIYINALEESNAKYEYLMGLPSIQDELKKNFRAVKPVRLEIHNGKEFVVYKCFIGTSKFDKEEMSMVLETILRYATELGIPTGAYYD